MKAAFLFFLASFPLAAAAQKLEATAPPVTYYVGLTKAPLYHSAADTAGKPSGYLFSQAEAVVVGRFSPRWVVVKHAGFLYLTLAQKLSDYDPADADALPVDAHTHRITYEGVVAVPGVSQADLYARAAAWVAQAYNSSNAVVKQQDPAAGQLVLVGTRTATVRTVFEGVPRGSYAGVVRHTLTVYVKDGRYKYILSDLAHDAAGAPNLKSGGPLEQDKAALFGYAGLGSRKPWTEIKVEATRGARRLLNGLQEAMTLQPVKAAKAPSEF